MLFSLVWPHSTCVERWFGVWECGCPKKSLSLEGLFWIAMRLVAILNKAPKAMLCCHLYPYTQLCFTKKNSTTKLFLGSSHSQKIKSWHSLIIMKWLIKKDLNIFYNIFLNIKVAFLERIIVQKSLFFSFVQEVVLSLFQSILKLFKVHKVCTPFLT